MRLRGGIHPQTTLKSDQMESSNSRARDFGMPTILQWLSQLFPYTHFFDLFLDQTQRGIPVYYSIPSITFFIVLTIIPILLSYRKLRKLLLEGSFLQRT